MRDIGPSLLRAQRARSILGKRLLIRVVLTYGANTYTYTTTKIKQLSRTEQTFSHKSQALVEDTDKVLHGLDLEGYKAVISRGLITRAGEEWIDLPPLWVVGQDRDSYRDRLECNFELEGPFDRMGKHKARSTLTLESTDTQTVKTLLTAIAEATLAPYTSYPAYTITFDSGYDDDGLIDTFIPADSFRVGLGETRLAKWKELMRYTDAVSVVKNDEEIHIFTPVKSGTTYTNEYTLVEGRDFQNFFNKRFRRRIVSPNYITFKNHPSHDASYTGFAKDASADLTDMAEYEEHYVRPVSNAQCTALAGALLSKYQMAAQKGSAVLPFVHFGQELYDYTNFVDARVGDSIAGNIGHITEFYKPGQFNMAMGFGRVPLGVAALQGLSAETDQFVTFGEFKARLFEIADWLDQILDILGSKVDIDDYNETVLALYEDAYFRNVTVTERLRIPVGANKYG